MYIIDQLLMCCKLIYNDIIAPLDKQIMIITHYILVLWGAIMLHLKPIDALDVPW